MIDHSLEKTSMTISRTTGLSEPSGVDKISAGTLGYISARHRQRQYDLVVREFRRSGISQSALARRLGKSPEVISRLLARPGNWESDTFSELVFGISGGIASYRIDYPLAASAGTSDASGMVFISASSKSTEVAKPVELSDAKTASSSLLALVAA
jgi:hypothetical protein